MLRPALEVPDTLPGRRLQLGEYALEIDARELRRPGARRGKRLTVKAQQVLLALALRPGEVLTRETLMDTVWPNSYPTGDVLTQAIVQLRRALDDDADAPRFIETIARSGYRLLCEVSWSTPSAEPIPAPGAASEAAGRYPGRLLWWLLPLLLIALFTGWADAPWWQVGSPAENAGQATLRTVPRMSPPKVLAASPQFEHQAALAADGSTLVLVVAEDENAPGALFLQSSAEFTSRQLTKPPDQASDDAPVWSPDQRWIAFRRRYGEQEDDRCELRLVSAASGAESLIGPCGGAVMGLAFTADGRELVAGGYRAPASGKHALRRIALDSGRVEPIVLDDDAAVTVYAEPRVSPDGRLILFRRGIATADLYTVPLQGGRPQPVTAVSGDIRGHDWLGTEGEIVFARVNENGIQLYWLNAAGGQPQLMEVSGQDPRSDATGRRIVIQQLRVDYLIRRFGPESRRLEAVDALRSSRNDMLPSPAPDGSKVAFLSDRSGDMGLWIAKAEGNDPAQRVDSLQPHPRFAPLWSPDSRYLWVAATGPEGAGLHEVEVASRRARRLDIAMPIGAVAVVDERRLLVNRGVDGGFRLGLFSRADGQLLSKNGIDGVGYLQFDPQGQQVLLTREGMPGLYVADLALSRVSLLRDDLLPPRLYRGWRLAGGHLWFLRSGTKGVDFSLWSLPLSDPGADPVQIAELDAPGVLLSDFGLLASEQMNALWLSEQSPVQSDIALLEIADARTATSPSR